MAWNQPNGGKNENPWGRRPGQAGSELDARLKNWQRKLESMFRTGGGGEGGQGGQGQAKRTRAAAREGGAIHRTSRRVETRRQEQKDAEAETTT